MARFISQAYGNLRPDELIASLVKKSIRDLIAADTTASVFVERYYDSYDEPELAGVVDEVIKGGGYFTWDPDLPKDWHDGGLYISPTVPYDGTRAGLEDYLNGVGETDVEGNGVWVRHFEGRIQADYYGCVGNKIADDQPSIQRALDTAFKLNRVQVVGEGRVGKTAIVEIRGTCRIKKYIYVPQKIILYGERNTLSYTQQGSSFQGEFNYINGPILWADEDIILYNGRTGKTDNCMVMLGGDSATIDGIVVDGWEIPFGTWFPNLRCRTASGFGGVNVFGGGELKVLDPSDFRQAGNLRVTTEIVPVAYLGDTWYAGYQLNALGGNLTGVGAGTATYTSINPGCPYQWDVISGTLPAGFAVSKSGWVTCTNPTTPGLAFIKVRVADASGSTAEKDLVFEVKGAYIQPAVGVMPPATVGHNYSYQVEVLNGGSTPYWFWLLNGPEGLTIDKVTGLMSGTPTANSYGKYKIKIVLTTRDNINKYGANDIIDYIEYDFNVEYGSYPTFVTTQLPTANIGVPYSAPIWIHSGKPPFTWTIDTSKTLPAGYENSNPGYPTTLSPAPGLTLTTDGFRGIISGTPTTSGGFHFFARVTDADGKSAVTLIIFSCQSISVQPQLKVSQNWNLPVAVKGQPYSYQLEASVPNCTFSGIWLPTGLSVSSSGLISGTPTGGRFANGVSFQYGDKLANCTIRNFRDGAGMYFSGPTNVHIVNNFFVASCDSGIRSTSLYDSRFEAFYIFACRVGMAMGGGTASNTFMNGRIEFIYEVGTAANFASENIFNSVYWDTCGLAAIEATSCSYWTFSNNLMHRSGRRVPPRGKHYMPDSFPRWSTHMSLDSCIGWTINGNTFIRGSQSEGSTNYIRPYETTKARDWVRPYTCVFLEGCKNMNITGNFMAGCTRQSIVSSVVDYEFNDNEINLNNNVVQTRNQFSYTTPFQPAKSNVLVNAAKHNFKGEGTEANYDPYLDKVSLLLHGHELIDRSPRAYTIGSTGVTINTNVFKMGTGSLEFNGITSILYPQEGNNGSSTAGFYFGYDDNTIELLIYPYRNNVAQTLIDFCNSTENTTFAIAMDSNGKLVIVRNRSTGGQTVDYTSKAVIPINTWSRIVVSRIGGSTGDVRVYINNVLDGRISTEFDNRFIISGYWRPTIGRGGFPNATDYYQGLMQEIRISKGIARYGVATTLEEPTRPYGDIDYGDLPVDTLIFPPGASDTTHYWGDRSYSYRIGPSSAVAQTAKVIRYSKNDMVGEIIGGNNSLTSGTVNPGLYYYNISKPAETGVTSYAYQMNEFQVWLARFGNQAEFEALRGKTVEFYFWARSANLNKLKLYTQFYAGTSDNSFAVDGGYFTEFNLKPFWRKLYFQVEVPSYELTRSNPANCNIIMKFVMDDKSEDYDWDFGAVVAKPADGRFGYVPYTE